MSETEIKFSNKDFIVPPRKKSIRLKNIPELKLIHKSHQPNELISETLLFQFSHLLPNWK